MRMPEVMILNNNNEDAYTDSYSDEIDRNQRIQFAMEVEQTAQRARLRNQAVQRAHGGGIDGPDMGQRRSSGFFGGK